MNKSASRLVVGLCATLVFASSASAYVLLNPPRKWFSTPRVVHVDNRGLSSVNDGSNGVNAAVGAVEAWNNAPGGPVISVTDGQSNGGLPTLGDGISDLYFGDPLGSCAGSCIAATYTGFYSTGQSGTCGSLNVVAITDSDIVFNLAYNYTTVAETDGCASEIYLEAVVTHEVGHLIGLGHSSVSSALMAPSLSYCINKPLASDDTSGRNALYNCSGGGGCTPPGGGCTSNGQCCSGSCKGKPGRKTCR
ncbi:MAG TPA: matrixin family metalloprotease [Candidatus Polarisedimenticolia bacterium]|nr:matrixin family metalloprotease [Candidatus Polarisedimenticolia bacterium]